MVVRLYVRGTDRRTGAPTKYIIFTGYASMATIAGWQADSDFLVEMAEAERGATV